MATADFEARQLLKAYRKGLITDELFEAQMREVGMGNGTGQYVFNGKSHATERELIMHLLDEFRCGETFAAEYLNDWIAVSDQACVKGGLRAVQNREAYHAQVLEARLRELGGVPQCTVPAERREKELATYATKDKTDAQKLLVATERLDNPAKVLSFITDVIDQIKDDQQSKELLRSLVQDEMSSITWINEACALMNPAQAAA